MGSASLDARTREKIGGWAGALASLVIQGYAINAGQAAGVMLRSRPEVHGDNSKV